MYLLRLFSLFLSYSLIPAALEYGKTTIVVVPLVGIMSQICNLCTNYNIPAKIWRKSDAFESGYSIVVVGIENAISEEFQKYLKTLHHLDKLTRIVIDECHTALTWRNFRHQYKHVCLLRVVPVPLVLMSATVPPIMENELKINFASDFHVLRDRTVKWNIRYSVTVFENQATQI